MDPQAAACMLAPVAAASGIFFVEMTLRSPGSRRNGIDVMRLKPDLHDTMVELESAALRVKAERDRALQLLREVLCYSQLGREGDYKTRVREFLESIEAR